MNDGGKLVTNDNEKLRYYRRRVLDTMIAIEAETGRDFYVTHMMLSEAYSEALDLTFTPRVSEALKAFIKLDAALNDTLKLVKGG